MSSSSRGGAFRASDNYVWQEADVVGRGGFGLVWRAFDKRSGRPVAVKACGGATPGRLVAPLHAAQHQHELAILQAIRHPNVVSLLAVEQEIGRSSSEPKVMVMELATEGSLHHLIEQPENAFGFKDAEFLLVLKHLESALSYLLSEFRIIHRDLKPGNILKTVDFDGRVLYKLCDFGTARILADEDDKFKSLVGTEEYLHPKIFKRAVCGGCSSNFSSESDLWSLGVTLFQLATGQLPFRPFGDPRSNRSRSVILEMTSAKPLGAVSAVEASLGAPIVWQHDLPPSSNLSTSLGGHVCRLVASLMETDLDQQWTFERFFAEAKAIVNLRHVDLLPASTCLTERQYAGTYGELVTASASALFIDGRRVSSISAASATASSTVVCIDEPFQSSIQPLHPGECSAAGGENSSVDAEVSAAKWLCAQSLALADRLHNCLASAQQLDRLLRGQLERCGNRLTETERYLTTVCASWNFISVQLKALQRNGTKLARKLSSCCQIFDDYSQLLARLKTIIGRFTDLIESLEKCSDLKSIHTDSSIVENNGCRALQKQAETFRELWVKFRTHRATLQHSSGDSTMQKKFHRLLVTNSEFEWKNVLSICNGSDVAALKRYHVQFCRLFSQLLSLDASVDDIRSTMSSVDAMSAAFHDSMKCFVALANNPDGLPKGSNVTDQCLDEMLDSMCHLQQLVEKTKLTVEKVTV